MARWLTKIMLGSAPILAVASAPHDAGQLDVSTCRGEERVTAVDLITTPPSLRAGEATLLTFRMNVFCPASVAWRIEAGERVVATGSHQAPPTVGGTVTVAASWIPAVTGEVHLRALADPDNALGESEAARKNNAISRSVMVALAEHPIRDPAPVPSPEPSPSPPPSADGRGEPGTRGTCTAWKKCNRSQGEGFIALRRARGAPSGFDYIECAQRLAVDVTKLHCKPDDRRHLVKKPWFFQPGDLALVPQQVECR